MINKKIIAVDRAREKNRVVVNWFLGKRCNYDCSYCPEHIHDNYSKHTSIDTLINFSNILLKKFHPENIKIQFTGGEPTVHPKFEMLCEYLSSKNISNISMNTNGTRTVDYYTDLWKYLKSFIVSHHFEYSHDEDFLDKIKLINDSRPSKKSFEVQVMFHAKHFEACTRAVEFYQQNNIKYVVRRIREWKADSPAVEYSEDQLKWLLSDSIDEEKNNKITGSLTDLNTLIFYENTDGTIDRKLVHVNEISAFEQNRFFGWHCWVGIDYLHISSDGTVYRGACREGGPVGNIIDTTLSLPSEPIICSAEICTCAPEISTKKFKNTYYMKLIKDE